MSGLPRLMIESLPEIAAVTRTEDAHLRKGDLRENIGALAVGLGVVSFAPAILTALVPASTSARAVIATALAWIVSEIVTRINRLALPSAIAACLLAEMGVVTCALMIPGVPMKGLAPDFVAMAHAQPGALAIALAVGAALMAWHYRLVHTPIDLGLAALLAGGSVMCAGQAIAPDLMPMIAHHLALTCAWIVLCAAFAFDLGDPERATRTADTAFWLHCAAGALFLFSVVACPGPFKELSVLIGFPIFAVAGILFDRMIIVTMTKSLLVLVIAAAVATADPVLALVGFAAFACLSYATTTRTTIRRRFIERTFWQIAPQLPPLREQP